jgi:hypothetical protein
MEGVLKAGSHKPQMLKPAGGGGGGGGGGGFGDVVNIASKVLPFFLKDGGVVPRHGYQTAGTVADLPIDAEIVERAPGLDPNVVSELKREERRQAAIPQEAKGLASDPTLIRSESGGNWEAENKARGHGGMYGHFGRAQFGHARLQDAMNAGVVPEGTTPEQFMKNPDLQKATEAWHFGDISKFIADKGYDRLIGTKINGIPVTEQGMINAAHLGGKGGLQRYLESGGQYNPDDKRKSLSDYMAMGAGMTGSDRSGQGLGAGRPPADVGRSTEGKPQELSFFDRNKGIILPVLQGIGAMASSKSISPFAAALQGLGAGAKAYGEEETRQAGVERERAGTTSTLSNIPIGNMIGTFNPKTGQIEYRTRPDYFAPDAFPPKKTGLEKAQEQAIQQGKVATGLIKPSTEGGAYTVDVEPGQTANREFSQYGYTGGEKDAYVVPSTIGTIPALAKRAADDQAAAQKRTEAGAMVPQTRLETNMLVDSVLGITPTGFAGAGPNQSSRARTVELYNWAARNIFGGAAETEKSNVSNAEIIRKLTTQLGTQFAGSQGFHASGLADALKDAQISGELTKEASIKLASSMYVRQQMEEDFSKYYNNYMKKYGTAYNVQNNFAREMGNQYEEEKKALQRALTPVEKDGKWSSPVTELRKNPALAPQFDAYFKKPGLARMLLGG